MKGFKKSNVYTLSLPEYILKDKLNYKSIGTKIDSLIKKHFLDKRVLIRCISGDSHKQMNINRLIAIIKKTGTDMYDPKRKKVCHSFYKKHTFDIFASKKKITKTMRFMQDVIQDFYEGALQDRGYPVRVDLLILYNPLQLKMLKL